MKSAPYEYCISTQIANYHFPPIMALYVSYISLDESQKDINTVQRCFVENQKGIITINFLQQ